AGTRARCQQERPRGDPVVALRLDGLARPAGRGHRGRVRRAPARLPPSLRVGERAGPAAGQRARGDLRERAATAERLDPPPPGPGADGIRGRRRSHVALPLRLLPRLAGGGPPPPLPPAPRP